MLYESSLIDSRKSTRPSTLEAVIRAETGSKIRSFLYQLSEGVTDYRSIHSLSDEQIALMEQESEKLDREFRLLEETYGEDHLDLVLATGYVKRLIENARVVRYMAKHYPELLMEFQKITESGPYANQ